MPAVLLFLLFHSVTALAMTVSGDAIQKQLDAALLVGKVSIEGIRYESHPQWHAKWIVTARLKEVESSKSDGNPLPQPGETFEIEGIGGEIDGTGITLTGFPRPYKGRSYRVYLQRSEDGRYAITGYQSGLVPIDGLRDFTRNRTDGSDGSGTGPFLYWDTSYFPIPYYIAARTFQGLAAYIPAIDTSFQTWSTAEGSIVDFLGMGCTDTLINANDGLNNIIYVDDNWGFDSLVIAITRNFYIAGTSATSGLILDSDILLNAVDHEFTTTGETGKHDVQNIMTHEIGHVIGLGHETSPTDVDATMYSIAATGETKKRELKSNDIAGLIAGYSGTADKVGGQSISCNVVQLPASCGAVHGTQDRSLPWIFLLSVALAVFFGRVFFFFRLKSRL